MNFLSSILFYLTLGTASASENKPDYQVGDVIMQSDSFKVAGPIKVLTLSKYNHVGIIVKRKGKLYVAEAQARVKYTSIEKYIKRGENHRHLRYKKLTKKEENKINKAVRKYIGKRYDPYLSWSDKRMYCSELVQKVYEDALSVNLVNKKQLKGHFMIVAYPLIKSGIVKVPKPFSRINKINVNEIVVTPGEINKSKLLQTVKR